MALLEVDGLRTEFRLGTGPADTVVAVDDVSLSLESGETVAVVGESGSGKTALAMSVLRLNPQPPTVYAAGQIRLAGRELLSLSRREMRGVRGRAIALVPQNPMTSLNPVRSVGSQIAEVVRVHRGVSRADALQAAVDALGDVGVADPEQRARQYPHQYSGGMRQRAMIAMALVCRPQILIADEPTTALDVTIQAQVMNLLVDLQRQHGTAILLVTHDLGVVARVADRVAVMYAGRVVETGSAERVFADPLMPYNWALQQATPRLDAAEGCGPRPIAGAPPDLAALPLGCSFAPRCAFARTQCEEDRPALTEREPGHAAACVLDATELRAEMRVQRLTGDRR